MHINTQLKENYMDKQQIISDFGRMSNKFTPFLSL